MWKILFSIIKEKQQCERYYLVLFKKKQQCERYYLVLFKK
ncbi:hypothetical protein BN191_430012 [Clostridioides difficile T61]|nr:hypothetical protein BN169_550011 [Clostridioides difficile E16]CCL94667.1 hypothetical protein BN191_430012 [Clostridioides difficile T61]